MQSFDPFQASLLFKAVKFHFTQEKYDFYKYNGKVTGDTIANKQKFLSNKQRFFYAKLSRHSDPIKLLVSNFIINPNLYINDIVDDKGQHNYNEWVARNASRYYNLEQELKNCTLNELLIVQDLPPIIFKYISGDMSPESVILIDSVTKVLDKMDPIHPLVEKHLLKLRKYKSFIQIDISNVKKIFKKIFTK